MLQEFLPTKFFYRSTIKFQRVLFLFLFFTRKNKKNNEIHDMDHAKIIFGPF